MNALAHIILTKKNVQLLKIKKLSKNNSKHYKPL